MPEKVYSPTDYEKIINDISDNLSQSPENWEARQQWVTQLGQMGKTLAREPQQEALQTLLKVASTDPEDEVRQNARQAVMQIWDACWQTRRQATIDMVLKTFDESSNLDIRLEVAGWIEKKANEIVLDDNLTTQILDKFIESAKVSEVDPRVKEAAWRVGSSIWEASWSATEDVQTHQIAVFNHFLGVLREETQSHEDWEVRKAAVDWLGKKADDIARNERMVIDATDALIAESREAVKENIKRRTGDAIKSIWDKAWEAGPVTEEWGMVVLEQVTKALGSGIIYVQKIAADWLKNHATDIAQNDLMIGHALDDLTKHANDANENSVVRTSARAACREIWDEGWKVIPSRDIVLSNVIDALQRVEGDKEDVEFRHNASEWLGKQAQEIAQNDRFLVRALEALSDTADNDPDEYTRRRADDSMIDIWNAGWGAPDSPQTHRSIVLTLVTKALYSSGVQGRQAKKAAAEWLGMNADEIATNDRLLAEVLDGLTDSFQEDDTTLAVITTIQKIWDKAWTVDDLKPAVFDQVLKSLKLDDLPEANYRRLRTAAAGWLDKNAPEVAKSGRRVLAALNGLFRRVSQQEDSDVRRYAREASKNLWTLGWDLVSAPQASKDSGSASADSPEITPIAIVSQVIKALENSDDRQFREAAAGWLAGKAELLAKDYEIAEKMAGSLDKIRKDKTQPDELRESAERALLALWEALKVNYPLEQTRKKLSDPSENERIRWVSRLSNENTLGSREAITLLVSKWVAWIQDEQEQRLVEITSEKLRFNDHAVLPLVEFFVKHWDEPAAPFGRLRSALQRTTSRSEPVETELLAEKRLRVRRRIARQLAEMSDPRFFDQSYPWVQVGVQKELREHAVPAIVQRLSEEKDVAMLEDMARVLLYSQEREGIDALAKEVVGEERTRKARQELLAEYYLEPSKARSDQAADILGKAIHESKRTLRILQTLNILVVLVGLSVLFYGLYFSITSDAAADRILGGLAAIGGLTGVIYQLVRDPLNRIQNANSNLVQMETAFTSFIWELNLNGTFIQSSYVNRGELNKEEIDSTLGRIRQAMKQTMSLVSIFTEQGGQRLVTRLTRLEPAAGSPGALVTIYGQHLLGDLRTKAETDQGRDASQAAGNRKEASNGMAAINHIPITGKAVSWDENEVSINLPPDLLGGPLPETVWVSLFVDGMETNALPFHVVGTGSGDQPEEGENHGG